MGALGGTSNLVIHNHSCQQGFWRKEIFETHTGYSSLSYTGIHDNFSLLYSFAITLKRTVNKIHEIARICALSRDPCVV